MTNDMSFYIGEDVDIEKISRKSFAKAAAEAGLGPKLAMKRLDLLVSGFEKALKDAADELYKQGFKDARKLAKNILQSSGYYLCSQQ